MITAGHIVLGASSVLFIFGLLSIFASALLPEFNNKVSILTARYQGFVLTDDRL